MKQVSRGGCEGEGNLACLDRVKTVLQMASQKVVSFVVVVLPSACQTPTSISSVALF